MELETNGIVVDRAGNFLLIRSDAFGEFDVLDASTGKLIGSVERMPWDSDEEWTYKGKMLLEDAQKGRLEYIGC